MRKIIVFMMCFVAVLGAKAQLRSVGAVPADLKMSVKELYEEDLQRARKYIGKRVKNKQEVLEASYQINKMMAGGHIVYGDPISHMIERIADTLLVDYPELRSELRFYTVTSPEVNAFMSGQGMLFVNVGLVAQVENEAQLAFIISHEIIHYYRSHSLEKLVGKNGDKKTKKEASLDDADNGLGDMLRRHARSREMENEADSLGIAMFYLKSPYSREVIDGVFDVLQYSELPFDDVPFDTTCFNTPWFSLTGCWLDTTKSITSRDDYDDRRSTHPNILKRRHACADAIDGYYGGEEYVITTPDEFMKLRQIARVESIRQEVIRGQYPRALYNSWLLLSDTARMDLPANREEKKQLETYFAYALYGNAMFRNRDTNELDTKAYQKVEGESQQLHYALLHMTKEEASLIALHRVWKLHRQYPDDEFFSLMAADLMDDLGAMGKRAPSDYSFTPPAPRDTTVVETPEPQKKEPRGKYDRIKQKRAAHAKQSPTTYALTDLALSDAEFRSQLQQHLVVASKDTSRADTNRIDGMIVFDPTCLIYDYNSEQMKVKKSASREAELAQHMLDVGKMLNIPGADFSDASMHGMTTDTQYNEFLTLCEWSKEFWRTGGSFDMHRLTQPAMDSLLDRHGANVLNYTVLFNLEGLSDFYLGYFLLPPFWPIALNHTFSGLEYTAMASVIVDARKGKVLSRQGYGYNVADHSDLVDAMLYDSYVRAMRPLENPKGVFGYRFSVAAGASFGPSGLQTIKQGLSKFAVTPWASIEYAVGRQYTLVLSGRYHPGYEEVKDNNKQTSADMLFLDLGFRRYAHSSFAPLGRFWGLGLHVAQITPLDKTLEQEYAYGLHISVGRNYILFHRMLLNYEITYSYTMGIKDFMAQLLDDYFSNNDAVRRNDAIFSNMLTFRLGLGILPF